MKPGENNNILCIGAPGSYKSRGFIIPFLMGCAQRSSSGAPESVIVIAGMNKVVDSLDAAVERARTVAAPQNKQRFDAKTPCEVTGVCADCKSDGCICNQILITRNCNPPGRIKFILVGEELGL
jgi:hypothetical protein